MKENLNILYMAHTVLSIHNCMNTINRAKSLEKLCNTVDRMPWGWNLTNKRLHNVMYNWNKTIHRCSTEVQNDCCVKYLSCKHFGGKAHSKWKQDLQTATTVTGYSESHSTHQFTEPVEVNVMSKLRDQHSLICCTKIGSLSL